MCLCRWLCRYRLAFPEGSLLTLGPQGAEEVGERSWGQYLEVQRQRQPVDSYAGWC